MNKQDYENIKALIMRCPLKGEEAIGVAQLLVKVDEAIKNTVAVEQEAIKNKVFK